jgi:hypothetical protein
LGIDVQIHVERMALLIGDDFRVDVLSTHERCMGSSQHLKVDPAETNLPQLINSTNVSTPGFGNTITGKVPPNHRKTAGADGFSRTRLGPTVGDHQLKALGLSSWQTPVVNIKGVGHSSYPNSGLPQAWLPI